jgi:hypothetical protein
MQRKALSSLGSESKQTRGNTSLDRFHNGYSMGALEVEFDVKEGVERRDHRPRYAKGNIGAEEWSCGDIWGTDDHRHGWISGMP